MKGGLENKGLIQNVLNLTWLVDTHGEMSCRQLESRVQKGGLSWRGGIRWRQLPSF